MSPIENLQSKDLEWISDFVMQQMVIMMRPLMEQLQQTDNSVEDAEISLQRLSMDVSEVRADLERTSKHLSILRQGVGMQNEARCMLHRGIENANRATKRLDEQMEGLLETMRNSEGTISSLTAELRELRAAAARHDDLGRQVAENTLAIDEMGIKADKHGVDVHALQDAICSSEGRMEAWKRELREVRRQLLGVNAKQIEDKLGVVSVPTPSQGGSRSLAPAESSWPTKKNFSAATAVDVNTASGKDAGNFVSAIGNANGPTAADRTTTSNSRQPKRLSRGSGAASSLDTSQHKAGLRSNNASHSGNSLPFDEGAALSGTAHDVGLHVNPRLPLLGVRGGNGLSGGLPPGGAVEAATRSQDNLYSEGPRWRFTATMAQDPA